MHLQTRGLRESLPTQSNEVPRAVPGVLVVDDDHQVRILLQLGLERSGFMVWMASNGRKAIELYRKHKNDIAVALLDVCMPGLDGPATMNALRSLNPNVPVCFMTGNAGAYAADDLRQLGVETIFAKPFALTDLTSQLRQFTTT